MHSFEDSTILWKAAIENPAPLFKSDPEDPMAAVFDTKGFFLSPEAKRLYNQEIEMDGKTFKLKNLPHIYTARTESENDFYFGISNQKGGRWKRSHAYHLRTPAYQILHKVPLRTRGDQDHWQWVQSWFDLASVQARGDDYVIRMKEGIVISFFIPNAKIERNRLLQFERRLIDQARRRGLRVLNKT